MLKECCKPTRGGMAAIGVLALLALATLWPVATATAATAPTVETGSASPVARNSAVLKAAVNPHGETVSECYFQYGTTVSYGTSVPCVSLPGSGESPVAVSVGVGSLSESTVYHFRIVATNPLGTTYGSDQTFETPPSPPTVVTGSVSTRRRTSATLKATVNPNGVNVSECYFEYGRSASYGSSVPCTSLPGSGEGAVAVSAPLASLTESTVYHFRIVASNLLGTSYGADQVFETRPNPPGLETSTASLLTQTSARLQAWVNPNGEAVSNCHFEYGTSVSYGSSVPCTSLPGSGEERVKVSAPWKASPKAPSTTSGSSRPTRSAPPTAPTRRSLRYRRGWHRRSGSSRPKGGPPPEGPR